MIKVYKRDTEFPLIPKAHGSVVPSKKHEQGDIKGEEEAHGEASPRNPWDIGLHQKIKDKPNCTL